MPVPSTLSGPGVEVFTRASELPSEVWDTLEAHAVNANVILPALLTSLAAERKGVVIPNQRWLVFYEQDNPALTVEFVLSCTNNGRMGTYPYPSPPVSRGSLARGRARGAGVLRVCARNYSTSLHRHLDEPHGCRASCARPVLLRGQDQLLQPAYAFSPPGNTERSLFHAPSVSAFPPLDGHQILTAVYLIKQNLIWVHEVTQGNKRGIACIAAFTRNSATVATITKVFTSEKYRRMGCAERLVRRVCDQ